MDLIFKIKKVIEDYSLIEAGDRVIIGVSGGRDSAALLYILRQLADEMAFKLFPVHIDHKLRGKESDDDKEFIQNETEKLGLELKLFEWNSEKEDINIQD